MLLKQVVCSYIIFTQHGELFASYIVVQCATTTTSYYTPGDKQVVAGLLTSVRRRLIDGENIRLPPRFYCGSSQNFGFQSSTSPNQQMLSRQFASVIGPLGFYMYCAHIHNTCIYVHTASSGIIYFLMIIRYYGVGIVASRRLTGGQTSEPSCLPRSFPCYFFRIFSMK
jgi:hypothetical protein